MVTLPSEKRKNGKYQKANTVQTRLKYFVQQKVSHFTDDGFVIFHILYLIFVIIFHFKEIETREKQSPSHKPTSRRPATQSWRRHCTLKLENERLFCILYPFHTVKMERDMTRGQWKKISVSRVVPSNELSERKLPEILISYSD